MVGPPGFVTVPVIFVAVFLYFTRKVRVMSWIPGGGPDDRDAQSVTTRTPLHGSTRPVGVVNEITNGAGMVVDAIQVGPGESPKPKTILDPTLGEEVQYEENAGILTKSGINDSFRTSACPNVQMSTFVT